MFNTILIKRRPWWSPLGTAVPANLSSGELAFNDVDQTLYYGLSTETAGVSSISIAGPGAFVSRTLAQDVSGSKTFKDDTTVDADLTVTGNLSVLGTQTVINTETINISGTSTQIDVINNGTGTGITVNQTGSQDVAEFKDDGSTALIIKDGGNVGVGTATPNEKLTVSGSISALDYVYVGQTRLDDASTAGQLAIGEASGDLLVIGKDGGVNTQITTQYAAANISLKTDGGQVRIDTAGSTLPTLFVNASDSTFAGTVSAAGAVDFDSTLDVVGATTLQSTLNVTSGATFASTVSAQGALTVEGLATFNADVTVTDKLQVQSSDFVLNTTGTHVEILGTDVKVTDDGLSADSTYGLNGITSNAIAGDYTIATNFAGGDIVISSNGGASEIDLTATNVNITTGDLEVQTGNLNGNGTNYIQDFIIDGGTF